MSNIIVALPKLEDAKKISELLRRRGLETSALCTTGAGVLNQVQKYEDGVVICGARFSDMYHNQLAEYLPEYFSMILLTSNPDIEIDVSKTVIVQMPFKAMEFISVVENLLTQIRRKVKKNKNGPKTRSKEEQQEIDKAKMLLMERDHMTEQEAFRYIQKCSMDSGTNMVETAQMILLMNCD